MLINIKTFNFPFIYKKLSVSTEGRIALFTSELVESGLIMFLKNQVGHGQGQG